MSVAPPSLYRASRIPFTFPVPASLGSPTAIDLAVLPKRQRPNGTTTWALLAVPVSGGNVTVELAGPDANGSGALVVGGDSDLFARVNGSDVLIDKVTRVFMRDGGTTVAPTPVLDAGTLTALNAWLNSRPVYPHA